MAPPTRPPFALGFAADAPTERALRVGTRRTRCPGAPRSTGGSAPPPRGQSPRPGLVFVDLDGIMDPAAAARQVTEVCTFETTLVAVGSVDTAEFSRQLLQGGVSDYLVKPVSPAAVREASLGAVGDLPDQRYAGRVVAFGGSAGSGTSTLIAAVARTVATDGRTGFGHRP